MSFAKYWNHLMVDLADPRSSNWPLMKDPIALIIIIACYSVFVKYVGPKLMENRKPFELKRTLMLYNFIQVLINLYIVYEGIEIYFFGDYSFKCQRFDRRRTREQMRVVRAFYIYLLTKITELLDTVFFVLRKKDKQISFLHVYHHAIVPLASWGCVKYLPGGHITLFGTVNSFVHVFMYFYYLMSAMGPQWQKYLWWKKYITILQMVQFFGMVLYSLQILLFDCGFPRWPLIIIIPNFIVFYLLFNNFYQEAYDSKKSKDKIKLLQNGDKQAFKNINRDDSKAENNNTEQKKIK